MKTWKRLMYGDLSYNNPMSVNYKGGKKAKKTEIEKKDKVFSPNVQEKVENKAKEDKKTVSEKRREKIRELKRSKEELEMFKNNNEEINNKRIR